MPKKLLAYHGKDKIRKMLIKEVKTNHRGCSPSKFSFLPFKRLCAVEIITERGNEKEFQNRFGIPVAITKLFAMIYKEVSDDCPENLLLDFVSAPKAGADLSNVALDFTLWLVTNEVYQIHLQERYLTLLQEILRETSRDGCIRGGDYAKDAAFLAAAGVFNKSYHHGAIDVAIEVRRVFLLHMALKLTELMRQAPIGE